MADQVSRAGLELTFTIPDAATDSNERNIEQGAFGTIIIPAGSDLIGKTMQMVAVSQKDPANFAPVALWSTPITLVAGANALSEDHIREGGGASRVLFRASAAVSGDSSFTLLWKS